MELVLKSELKFHDKRMIELFKDVSLNFNAGNLVSFDNQFFFYGLHRVDLLCLAMADEVDFTVAAPADYLQDLEIRLLDRALN